MKNTDRVRIFNGQEGVIKTLALKFAQKYNRSYIDLVEEASDALLNYLFSHWEDVYDPEKSTEGTWSHYVIYSHLRTICTQTGNIGYRIHSGVKDQIEYKPYWFSGLLQEVSEEGAFLLKIIINAPSEIAEDMKKCSRARSKPIIKKYLSRVAKWNKEKIKKVWEEVALCL